MENTKLLCRLSELCKEKGISQTTAYIESGVGKNFKSNMKTANPSLGKITMLANYFGVSVDFLLGDSDKRESSPIEELSERKKEVIKLLDSLSDEQVDLFIAIMKETIKNRGNNDDN